MKKAKAFLIALMQGYLKRKPSFRRGACVDTLVAKGTCIDGDIEFTGFLRVDGEVRGNVIAVGEEGGMLIVAESGRIVGSVKARNLVVDGSIEGDVFVREFVELFARARVRGNLQYQSIDLHVGASFVGTLQDHTAVREIKKLPPAVVSHMPTASSRRTGRRR